MADSRTSAESGLCWLSKGCWPAHTHMHTQSEESSVPLSQVSYSVYWFNLSRSLWGSSWPPNFFFHHYLKYTYAHTQQFTTFKLNATRRKSVKGNTHQIPYQTQENWQEYGKFKKHWDKMMWRQILLPNHWTSKVSSSSLLLGKPHRLLLTFRH